MADSNPGIGIGNGSQASSSKKKKKEAAKEGPPPVPEGWTRCNAYLPKKHRFCRQLTLTDSIYCGNHMELEDEKEVNNGASTSSATADNGNDNNPTKKKSKKRKRVPCPLDQSHSIYEDMVERHLKICPKAKQHKQQEGQPYYQKNINGGGHGSMEKTISNSYGNAQHLGNSNPNSSANERLARAEAFALRVLFVHQRLFVAGSTVNPTTIKKADIIHLSLDDIESALPLKDLSDGELEKGLSEAIESYHIRSGGPKHIQQQASLLGHLRRLSSPDDTKTDISQDNTTTTKDTLMLELGAGRGMLGLVSAGAFAASSSLSSSSTTSPAAVDLIMIERAGTRSKADTILRNHKSNLEGRCLKVEEVRDWQRIQCDLAHVHMPTVMALQDEKAAVRDKNTSQQPGSRSIPKQKPIIMAIAKHLCGAGTDLALKALYPIRDQIQVCMMATCCHGVCSWEHYIGRDYLASALTEDPTENSDSVPALSEFGEEDFETLRLWSSGTVKDVSYNNTSSTPASNNDDNNNNGDGDGQNQKAANAIEPVDTRQEKEEVHYCPDFDSKGTVTSVSAVATSLRLKCGVQGLGRACQRLLDYGRKQYMEQVLFADKDESSDGKALTELCYYVPSSVTPQNAVLIASRRK